MVNLMVEKATSDLLIGPDWARNIEICDLLNQDPAQAKDIVKGIKKRIWSKNSKVQLLALTLLETIVKNCGDIVHMHVAEREVPHEMVKITRKKPDFHVKEKILILIDTWQEAFGGPRARYPQYYAAYQELLRAGAVFPPRSESSAPVFTPPQTQPLSSYPQNLRNPENHQETAEASAETEYPTLSLTDIQNAKGIMENAKGIMEVLAEMLSAIDPANNEAVRQDTIDDLVMQCRTYKQRVLHLINSTSSESLLCQGLAVNDDLQKVLDKYEAIASGTSFAPEISKPEPNKGLVDVDAPLVDTGETSKQIDARSASSATIPAPTVATPTKVDPKFDLLSGDLISADVSNTPTAQDTLALVPVSAPLQSSPVANQQNALALFDMFDTNSTIPDTSNSQHAFPSGQGYPSAPEFQQQQNLPPAHSMPYANGNGMASSMGLQHQQNLPTAHSIPYANGSGMVSSMGLPQHEQAGYPQHASASWSTQGGPQQPQPPIHGTQNDETLPPPPWESQPTETNPTFNPQYSSSVQPSPMVAQQSPGFQGGMHPFAHQPTGNDQVAGMYNQHMTGHMPAINPHSMQSHPGMYPQHYPTQPGQMGSMYPPQMYPNQMAGYGYGYTQQLDTQYLDNRMYGMSMTDNSSLRNSSSQPSMASYLPPMKQKPKGDDTLFGDLVDMAKLKPVKSSPSL